MQLEPGATASRSRIVDSMGAHLPLTERGLSRKMATTETKWVCVGYDHRRQRHDALAYIRETGAEAEATCRPLHQHFEIYFTKEGDLY